MNGIGRHCSNNWLWSNLRSMQPKQQSNVNLMGKKPTCCCLFTIPAFELFCLCDICWQEIVSHLFWMLCHKLASHIRLLFGKKKRVPSPWEGCRSRFVEADWSWPFSRLCQEASASKGVFTVKVMQILEAVDCKQFVEKCGWEQTWTMFQTDANMCVVPRLLRCAQFTNSKFKFLVNCESEAELNHKPHCRCSLVKATAVMSVLCAVNEVNITQWERI